MPTNHWLDVPGARLYYEVRGSGPVLMLVGHPMDSSGFAAIASSVIAAGTTSTGQYPRRAAVALAERLGTPVIDFPGGHAGFTTDPQAFASVLRHTLAGTSPVASA